MARSAQFWISLGLLLASAGCVVQEADVPNQAPQPQATAARARPEKVETITVATWNLEWFFDSYLGDNNSDLAKEQSPPNSAEWFWKRDRVAEAVAQLKPTILAVQEVESRRTLHQLNRALRDQQGMTYHEAFIEGDDFGTEQDVGVIHQGGLVEYSRREQTAASRKNRDFYSVTKHLCTRFEFGEGKDVERLLIVNVHLRAQPDGEKLRRGQARLIRTWIDDALARGENVIVLGDLNSNHDFDKAAPDSEIGILCGLGTENQDDDLIDLHAHLPQDSRATHLTQKQFDRILVSPSLMKDDPQRRDLVFTKIERRKDVCVRGKQADKDHWNIYYKIPQDERDVSDHYPLIAEFELR